MRIKLSPRQKLYLSYLEIIFALIGMSLFLIPLLTYGITTLTILASAVAYASFLCGVCVTDGLKDIKPLREQIRKEKQGDFHL